MVRASNPRKKTFNARTQIPVFREDQIELDDEDLTSTLQEIETGVDKSEEIVCRHPHHPLPVLGRLCRKVT